VEQTYLIAHDIVKSLGIDRSIRNIYFENTDSPWNEKALIKRKKDYLDVKATIWDDKEFLYGRIYRLFLYVYDVLNPQFQYNPQMSPDEYKEPRLKDRHNQIWSIYVDSRIEKGGIENFFNKAVRKNIFIDAEKDLTWEESSLIFQKLWERKSYTYPEITNYTYNLSSITENKITQPVSFELDMIKRLKHLSVKDHIDNIQSGIIRKIVNELLSYTAYHCKDIFFQPSHFGITMTYHKVFFAEMIPTMENTLLLTLINPISRLNETTILTEESDIESTQQFIRDTYNRFSMQMG